MGVIMDVPLLSISSLAIAIIISGYSRINLGIICIGLAFIIGHFFADINMAQIYVQGFPLSLFFLLLGTTLFSSIARQNGTYIVLSKQLAYLSYGNRKIGCLIIFAGSFIFSFLGMGTIVTPAIIMPLFLHFGWEEEIPEALVIPLTIAGSITGGLSILAPTGIIGSTLGAEVGVTAYWPIYIAALGTFILHGIIIFFMFGGHKLTNMQQTPYEPMVLDWRQFLTIIAAFGVITAILGFHLDLGLSAFFGSALLLLCKAADQDKAIKGIAWNVMLLLCGVSTLFYVMKESGGIAALEAFLKVKMTAGSAGVITYLIAGVMSIVSSSTIVVMPTMIAMVPQIGQGVGREISPLFLTAAIIIGSHTTPYSPASTMGAIGLAFSSCENKYKMFIKLLSTAGILLVVTALLYFFGAYNFLNNF